MVFAAGYRDRKKRGQYQTYIRGRDQVVLCCQEQAKEATTAIQHTDGLTGYIQASHGRPAILVLNDQVLLVQRGVQGQVRIGEAQQAVQDLRQPH